MEHYVNIMLDGGYDGRRVSGNHGTDCLGWG